MEPLARYRVPNGSSGMSSHFPPQLTNILVNWTTTAGLMRTFSTNRFILRAAAMSMGAIWLLSSSAMGQVSTNVTVKVGTPILYAQNAATATMPTTGLGLGTSVYAGQWANSGLPGLIAGSGTQMVRYPGGSYSDIYNWSLGTANEGGYVAPNSSMGTYFKVLDQSGAQGIITVNYGSNTTATMGPRHRRPPLKSRMRIQTPAFMALPAM